MDHLEFLYPVHFERSGGYPGGGTLPDHAERKLFDPWGAGSVLE